MSLINWKIRPLPAEVHKQGFNIPIYLDEESINKLKGDSALCNEANWLIHIYKEKRAVASTEKKLVKKLIRQLNKAVESLEELSPTNQSRINNYSNQKILRELADRATKCEKKPLPKKLELEQLYLNLGFKWQQYKRSGMKRDFFNDFMTVVIRHIDNRPISVFEADKDNHIRKLTDVVKKERENC